MGYRIKYALLYTCSLLPWFVMYRISDLLTWLVFRVFPYRKDVVLGNLKIAFPEKTDREREKIAFQFYRLLMDTIVETIKLVSLSKEGVKKRFSGDAGFINDVMDQYNNLQVMALHNFNWEIVNLNISMQMRHPFIGVYMPIQNPFFERLMRGIRTRYGTELIRATEFKGEFPKYTGKPHILALVADQSPGKPDESLWFPFFGKLTPFVAGPERGARIFKKSIIFGHFFPVKRGHYSFTFKVITGDASQLPEGELTRQYVEYVEECIRMHPENYLWSHRRWKHAKDLPVS